jgi:hypothetical protein
MKNIVAILTVFLVLGSGNLAAAQSTGDFGTRLGDVLGGLLSGRPGSETRSWHGHLVQARGTTMIFRAEDGKIYAVDMSAINTETWHPIVLGQALTLAARPGSEPQTLVAARLEPEQPDRAGQLREKRAFRTVHGTVERVEGSQVTVRSLDGTVLPVDVARMTGEAQFRTNDGAAVILEPGQGNTVVWIVREDRRDGRGGDILSGLPGEYQRLHGDRVHVSGATMIVRADDGKTYAVDMSALETQMWHPIELGQAVTLAAKPGREPNALIAARLQADPADRATGKTPKKPFISAQGTIESAQDSELRFKMPDGRVVWADASQMPGRAAVRVNDQGTLIYDRDPRQRVTALWFERSETQPSAAPIPSAAPTPRVVRPGEYQRIYGYVQSVGGTTMSFKADDGRILTVDTTQVDAQVRSTVRQGDLVSVLGKTTARADQFVAEVIERETRR